MSLEPSAPARPVSSRVAARLLLALGLAAVSFAGCSADGSEGDVGRQTSTTAADPVSTTTSSTSTTVAVTTTTRPELSGVDPAGYLLAPEEFGAGWTVDATGEGEAESTSPCPGQEGSVEVIDSSSAYLTAADDSATGSQGVSFHRDAADAGARLTELGESRTACAGTIELEGVTATVAVTELDPGVIGDEQLGYRFDISAGGVTYVGFEIAYRQGPLVGSVALIGFPPDVDQARIEELARRAAAVTGAAIGG